MNLDGFRILRGAVNVGDYIRIANGNPSMATQWWKVTAKVAATLPGRPDLVDMVNAEGGIRTRYALNPGDKIVRHPCSGKVEA